MWSRDDEIESGETILDSKLKSAKFYFTRKDKTRNVTNACRDLLQGKAILSLGTLVKCVVRRVYNHILFPVSEQLSTQPIN